MSKLRETIAQSWWTIQDTLFPRMIEELGPLTQKQQELITTLEMLHIEAFIDSSKGYPGRPPKDRVAIARAFVAKMVYHMPTTRLLLDRLHTDIALRRLCVIPLPVMLYLIISNSCIFTPWFCHQRVMLRSALNHPGLVGSFPLPNLCLSDRD